MNYCPRCGGWVYAMGHICPSHNYTVAPLVPAINGTTIYPNLNQPSSCAGCKDKDNLIKEAEKRVAKEIFNLLDGLEHPEGSKLRFNEVYQKVKRDYLERVE